MKTLSAAVPTVLAFSAHDPSGAAGIQADIESINRNGARCVSVITALTAQNTGIFGSLQPQAPSDFRNQAELLLTDITVNVCKVGLVGSTPLITEIAVILKKQNNLPLVLDPVLRAGSGEPVSSDAIIAALRTHLLPRTTVLTPNLQEVLQLTGEKTRDAAAEEILTTGCRSVLITGADETTASVINTLYTRDHEPVQFEWERLPGTYHGSGCTLASAIAALLARGMEVNTAVRQAQQYTWHALQSGYHLGKSQLHPDRNYMDRS